MSGPSSPEGREGKGARETGSEPIPPSLKQTVERAQFRLGIMEWVALGGAVIMSLVGGIVVAFFLSEGMGLPFRLTWAVSSLLLFTGPALAFMMRKNEDGGSDAGG